jgi:hypothetical protein
MTGAKPVRYRFLPLLQPICSTQNSPPRASTGYQAVPARVFVRQQSATTCQSASGETCRLNGCSTPEADGRAACTIDHCRHWDHGAGHSLRQLTNCVDLLVQDVARRTPAMFEAAKPRENVPVQAVRSLPANRRKVVRRGSLHDNSSP